MSDFSGAVGIPQFMKDSKMTPLSVESSVAGIFHIHGEICQVAHIILAPEQKIQIEPGTMNYMSDEVVAETKIGGFGRLITEGNIFKSIYTNKSKSPGYIGVTANFPATIIPMNLDRLGGAILSKHDAFLGAMDPNAHITWKRLRAANCLACCCSGLPFTMQEVKAQGWIFMAAHGSIVEKKLSDGENIIVDTDSIVALTPGVSVDVEKTGGCLTICCGSEGMFNTALKGPGTVWLSSMPMEKLRKLFYRPQKKNNRNGADRGAAGQAATA